MNNHKTSVDLMESILGFIVHFKSIYGGCSPTLRECCEYVNATRGGSCSPSYLVYVLGLMEERGMIVRLDDLESRNIAVPGYSWRKDENGD